MADATFLQKKQGKYLWYGLLQLGIQPDSDTQASRKHIDLGPDMFSKPNRDAFHIVVMFLLKKLDKARVTQDFKYCYPVISPKDDGNFRKLTCEWLKEILGNKALPSLLLSPGGPKFISMMLDLVNHVMLQEIKTVETGGSWVPQAGMLPVSSLHMARERLKVVQGQFLRVSEDQKSFIEEYEKRVQDLVKSKKEISENAAKYEELLKRFSNNSTQEGSSLAEEAQKARITSAAINGILAAGKAGRESVESALRIKATDENVLDGADIDFKIPQNLRARVEKLPHQLSSGSVYKDGKLNFLSMLELSHCSLELLRDENRRLPPSAEPVCRPQDLQGDDEKITSAKQSLQLLREELVKEKIPEARKDNRELEMSWDKKWADHLKDASIDSFLDDPVLDFQSVVGHLSFESDSAANFESVLSLYPATLVGVELPESEEEEEGVQTVPLNPMKSVPERAASPALPAEAPPTADTSLYWCCDSPPAPSPPTPEASVTKAAPALLKVTPVRTRAQILDLECDTLADQLAEAVTSAAPADGSRTGTDFECLLNTLQADPFSARKQIPRTPESLLKDVRSSWRKVLEEDEKAKKGDQSCRFDSSITSRLSPLRESPDPVPSGDARSTKVSFSVTPAAAGRTSPPKSSLLWDSTVHFSLEDETLPEVPGCDSLLSLDDEEEEEDKVQSPNTEAERSLQTRRDDLLVQLEQVLSPERPLSETVGERVFSLDLDKLETPKRTEFSLPQLITFSPIDDV